MNILKKFIALFLCSAITTFGQGNSFDKVRYNGGSVDSKVDPKDWHNQLTVTSDMIILALKDGKKLEISPKTVTSLSYGQEAHRRVGTMIALAILVSPIALFGLMHKTRLHYIGIQYTIPDNKTGGILLQGDKDNYRAILVALQGVTGVPVSVGEKDREFIPVSLRTQVTKGEEEKTAENKPAESKPTETAPTETAKGTVNVSSNPSGADVLVDGDFVGNSPAALKLSPGKHTLTVKISGYIDWSKEITVQSGSEVQLTANLEKSSPQLFESGQIHQLECSNMFNKKSFFAVLAQVMLSVLLLNQVPLDIFSATCTGADPCKACKNCKYCKHCAKDGGKCGVCK